MSTHSQNFGSELQPLNKRRNRIAVLALLFAWPILTLAGGYLLQTQSGDVLEAVVKVVQTAGDLNVTSEVAKESSPDHDLSKSYAVALSALQTKFDQQSANVHELSEKGMRQMLAFVIGWMLMSVISVHVAIRGN